MTVLSQPPSPYKIFGLDGAELVLANASSGDSGGPGPGSGWDNPLADAGILNAYQCCRGNGDLSPRWLWQDLAMTIPATEAGDIVAAWQASLGIGVGIQSNPLSRPQLQFNTNGVPYLAFDGVDDYLVIPGFSISQWFAVLSSYTSTWNTYWTPLGNLTTDGPRRAAGLFWAGTQNMFTDPTMIAVRKNGVDLAGSFFNMSPIQSLMTLNVTSYAGSSASTPSNLYVGVGCDTGLLYYGEGGISAIAVPPTTLDGPTSSTIEDYLMTMM